MWGWVCEVSPWLATIPTPKKFLQLIEEPSNENLEKNV